MVVKNINQILLIVRTSVKCLTVHFLMAAHRGVQFVPSLCGSALLGEQSVSAALGISGVAGSGWICRSRLPGSPAVLIFKGKWGRRLQCYIDRSGYGNFTKKCLCSGGGLGLKDQGTHGVMLPWAINSLSQNLSFLGSSCRACRLCTVVSPKLHWAEKTNYAASLWCEI